MLVSLSYISRVAPIPSDLRCNPRILFTLTAKRALTISAAATQPTSTTQLSTLLKDKDLIRNGSFIANNFRSPPPHSSTSQLAVTNPYDGTTLHHLHQATTSDIDHAIQAASIAQPIWAREPIPTRSNFLTRWCDLILSSKRDLATIVTLENGKPLLEAEKEVEYAASFLTWAAQRTLHSHGSQATFLTHNKHSIVTHDPIGVVLAITPWNFPLAMLTRKVAPAVAAGCAVIAKPSELTPLAALALAELALRAGAPPGLFNVLVSQNPAEISQRVLKASCVRMLSFTGSTKVGKVLMKLAAERVVRVSLELGGHAPMIVFDDAELEKAVHGLIANKMRCGGQTCIATSRVFVHENVYEEFGQLLANKLREITIGDGLREDVEVGPMIHKTGMEKVEMHVNDALEKGAKVLFASNIEKKGLFYPVTLLRDVMEDMLMMREETFGPVIGLTRFAEDEDIAVRANSEDAGLACYVYTRDLGRAMRMSRDLEYGMVGINDTGISDPLTEFGGTKESGIGREGGYGAIEHFMEAKHTFISF